MISEIHITVKIFYKTLGKAEREEILNVTSAYQCHVRPTRLCYVLWNGLQHTDYCETGTSISVKEILILEIVLFSHYPHEPVPHLHFYLFLGLTPLSITRSSIFLKLSMYSRCTVKLNLDDPSV